MARGDIGRGREYLAEARARTSGGDWFSLYQLGRISKDLGLWRETALAWREAGTPGMSALRSWAQETRSRDQWDRASIAWQSAGRTPEPWLGPDILAVIDELAGAEAASGVLVCACGFVADHLEVLYDLDIEASRVADEVGIAFARTDCVNDDPGVLGALADRVVALVGGSGGTRATEPT